MQAMQVAQAAQSNNYVVGSYILYTIISVALTIWVARTLYKNGILFLIDAFGGNERLAHSVNHLLVVGFYLINIGYVTLALKYGDKPATVQQSIEFLSTKVGLVLLVLGAMHFLNLRVFSNMRKRALLRGEKPPVAPNEFLSSSGNPAAQGAH
jgi:hypothetical protein